MDRFANNFNAQIGRFLTHGFGVWVQMQLTPSHVTGDRRLIGSALPQT